MVKKAWRFKKILSVFRLKSVLSKMLILLMAVAVGLVGIFYSAMNHTYQEESRERAISECFMLLNFAGNQLGESLSILEAQLDAVLSINDVPDAILSDNILEQPAILTVVNEFYRLSKGNPLVEEVLFYVKSENVLISSAQSAAKVEAPEDRVLLTFLESQVQQAQASQDLVCWDDQLYWTSRYPEGKTVAILAVRLNQAEFFEQLSRFFTSVDSGLAVFPFVEEQPALPQQISYPDRSKFQIVDRQVQNELDELCTMADSARYLLVHQMRSHNLTLLGIFQNTQSVFSFRDVIASNLFLWVGTFSLLLLACLCLVSIVYPPLLRIAAGMIDQRDMANGRGLPENTHNEYELIQNLFLEQKELEKRLGDMLRQTGGAVEDRLFSNIIKGNEQDVENIQMLLGQMGSSFSVELLYQVILLAPAPGQGQGKPLDKPRVRQRCQEYWRGKALVHSLEMDGRIVLILAFSPKTTERKRKEFLADFQRVYPELFENLSGLPLAGAGEPKIGILGLSESYQKAWDVLQREICASQNWGSEEERFSVYRARLRGCLDQLAQNGEDGQKQLLAVLEEAVPVPQLHLMAAECIFEYLTRCRADCPPQVQELRQALEQAPTGSENAERFQKFLDAIIPKLTEMSGKAQVQYLEGTKRYIKDHYADSLLSLSVVSDSCGISKGYLSRLFIEYCGQSFSDYLNGYRISQACALLKDSDLSISEIAVRTGFNSPQNFNRVFKRHMGKTPRQFRMREENPGK